MVDEKGRFIAHDKHVLSMKDNNQSANLAALVDAGVRSFKIEGRYKDMGYVKNITAHYRKELDAILEDRPDLARASSGRTAHFFLPDPDKTFHRGSTDYFVTERKVDIGAFDSPTFTGLAVGNVEKVNKRDLYAHSKRMWNHWTNRYAFQFLDRFDIMLEAKDKNLAALDFHHEYRRVGA